MADKAISELVSAEQITATDMFVLEQNGTAKKLTGQVLLNWLTAAADGHGGIQSIVKRSTSGLADTYRITMADTTFYDFMVTNGRGISSLQKTGTSGLVDTYTFTYNDDTTATFTVTNGQKGDKGDNAYIWVKYASQEPTASSNSFGDLPDDWMGVYFGTAPTAPTNWQSYKWYRIRGEKGDTGEPATIVKAEITYQTATSGTIIPSGSWSASVPPVTPGRYLWTRQVLQFNTGAPITSYSVSRFGVDGSGAVSTVAGVAPDENGNVPLDASSVKALAISGGIMEGPVNMNGQKLSGLNSPTADDEAATKGFVTESVKDKVNKTNVVNDFTITEEGYVADARALKVLNDSKMSMELLWENPSPASEFAEQTIGIDMSGYRGFMIVYVSYTVNPILFATGVLPKESHVYCLSSISAKSDYTDADVSYRSFTVSNTGFTFQKSYYNDLKGTDTMGASIKSNIPYKIYGIKGVSA